jgi:hypothetical protein
MVEYMFGHLKNIHKEKNNLLKDSGSLLMLITGIHNIYKENHIAPVYQ